MVGGDGLFSRCRFVYIRPPKEEYLRFIRRVFLRVGAYALIRVGTAAGGKGGFIGSLVVPRSEIRHAVFVFYKKRAVFGALREGKNVVFVRFRRRDDVLRVNAVIGAGSEISLIKNKKEVVGIVLARVGKAQTLVVYNVRINAAAVGTVRPGKIRRYDIVSARGRSLDRHVDLDGRARFVPGGKRRADRAEGEYRRKQNGGNNLGSFTGKHSNITPKTF